MPNAANVYEALRRRDDRLASVMTFLEDTSSDEYRAIERERKRINDQRKALARFITDKIDRVLGPEPSVPLDTSRIGAKL